MTDGERTAADAAYEFMQLVSASTRSASQRERLRKALDVPITQAGLAALTLVRRERRLTIGDLGRRLDVDQSTISRQVRPLEEQGLLQREADPDDGRISWLTVTDAGARLLARVEAVARNDFDVALAAWNHEDRARLTELLDRLRTDLRAVRTDDTGWSVRNANADADATNR
jgi:DNA-binding MarR family transcriptional regulator